MKSISLEIVKVSPFRFAERHHSPLQTSIKHSVWVSNWQSNLPNLAISADLFLHTFVFVFMSSSFFRYTIFAVL